jgi:DNA-binding NarL/FixJ family response regulator
VIAPPRSIGDAMIRLLHDAPRDLEVPPVVLPAVEPEPVPLEASALRILIADDEPTMRDAVRDLLENLGFEVVGAACDGLSAVEMADELRPDVVLMDLRMPSLDGVEATRRIRSAHPDVRVVLLSAYDDPAFRAAADRAGACCYLAKGCRPEALEQAIRSGAG